MTSLLPLSTDPRDPQFLSPNAKVDIIAHVGVRAHIVHAYSVCHHDHQNIVTSGGDLIFAMSLRAKTRLQESL